LTGQFQTGSSTYKRRRYTLARQLRSYREAFGVSGNQFAKLVGWAQSKVSRIETGAQLPSDDDLKAIAHAVKLSKGELGGLLALLEQAEAEYKSWKENYTVAGGAGKKQRQIQRLEQGAKVIREFQPVLVPGLFQTRDYATELLSTDFGPARFGAALPDVHEMVSIRIERQQVLYDKEKRVSTLICEAALHTRVTSIETHFFQLLRLFDLASLPSVQLSILPFSERLNFIPLSGFAVYDHDFAILETLSGEQQLSHPEEVEVYVDAFETAVENAAIGPEARQLVEKAYESIRGISGGIE
jgi:transcriptional regulator with XRE-family HTH domain